MPGGLTLLNCNLTVSVLPHQNRIPFSSLLSKMEFLFTPRVKHNSVLLQKGTPIYPPNRIPFYSHSLSLSQSKMDKFGTIFSPTRTRLWITDWPIQVLLIPYWVLFHVSWGMNSISMEFQRNFYEESDFVRNINEDRICIRFILWLHIFGKSIGQLILQFERSDQSNVPQWMQ